MVTGSAAMVCVGGSVAVSSVLYRAPVFTAEAIRYAVACLLLVAWPASPAGSCAASRC